MRLLSTLDWNDFFEKVSLIEPLLGKDPAGVYSRMEFASRDRYRHVIERISKRTRASELEDRGSGSQLRGPSKRRRRAKKHVGYYLIDDGLSILETIFGYQPRTIERLRRFLLATRNRVLPRHSHVSDVLIVLFLLIVTMQRHGTEWPMSDRHCIARADSGQRSRPHCSQLGSHALLSATSAAAHGHRRRHSRRSAQRSSSCQQSS